MKQIVLLTLTQESETNVVNLSQDNSRAIKGMLAYLYGIHFDTLEAFANTESSMRCDLDETELVLYQLDLYVVSTKYLMSDLSDRTRNVFQTLVHSGTDTDLSKLAVQVYLTYADEATELRKDVVDLFVGNIEECKDDRKFQDLLVNIPDLASDMVRALANANLRCRRKF